MSRPGPVRPDPIRSDLAERLLVVIPAWNEERTVGDVVARVRHAVPTAGVVVVDDASTDRTRTVAVQAGATVLSLPLNLGVGGAMRTGFRYALRHGYTQVVQVDADGQHDPAQLPVLLEQSAHAEVVIGARFAGVGSYRVRGPRRWAMVALALWLSRITGTRLTDVTSGFRLASGSAVPLFARHYPAEYLGDTVQTLVIAARGGCRVVQVPVAMHERAGGQPSQSPLRAAAYLGRAVLALLLAVGRSTPAQLDDGLKGDTA